MDHRTILNGIPWILRTGAPWRDLPECYGPWRTVAGPFYGGRNAGLWGRTLGKSRKEYSTRFAPRTYSHEPSHAATTPPGGEPRSVRSA